MQCAPGSSSYGCGAKLSQKTDNLMEEELGFLNLSSRDDGTAPQRFMHKPLPPVTPGFIKNRSRGWQPVGARGRRAGSTGSVLEASLSSRGLAITSASSVALPAELTYRLHDICSHRQGR